MLLERVFGQGVNGKVTLSFDPIGLSCLIEIPFERLYRTGYGACICHLAISANSAPGLSEMALRLPRKISPVAPSSEIQSPSTMTLSPNRASRRAGSTRSARHETGFAHLPCHDRGMGGSAADSGQNSGCQGESGNIIGRNLRPHKNDGIALRGELLRSLTLKSYAATCHSRRGRNRDGDDCRGIPEPEFPEMAEVDLREACRSDFLIDQTFVHERHGNTHGW
jgi:hypothetical protein